MEKQHHRNPEQKGKKIAMILIPVLLLVVATVRLNFCNYSDTVYMVFQRAKIWILTAKQENPTSWCNTLVLLNALA